MRSGISPNRLRARPRGVSVRGSLPVRCRIQTLRLALLLAAVATPAWAAPDELRESEAQTHDAPVDLVPGSRAMKGVRVYGEQTFSVNADFGPVDVSEYHSTLGLRAGGPVHENFLVRARAAGDISVFDYSGDRSQFEADLLLDDPTERLYDVEFALGGAYRLPIQQAFFGVTPRWSIFAEGSADLAWEDGASLSDAVEGSGALGIGFELEPKLEVAVGVDVGSKMDDSGVSVNPIFAFRWQIRDD